MFILSQLCTLTYINISLSLFRHLVSTSLALALIWDSGMEGYERMALSLSWHCPLRPSSDPLLCDYCWDSVVASREIWVLVCVLAPFGNECGLVRASVRGLSRLYPRSPSGITGNFRFARPLGIFTLLKWTLRHK